jgi:hypothetical protein
MSETEVNDTYTAKAAPFAVRQKDRLASIPLQGPQATFSQSRELR